MTVDSSIEKLRAGDFEGAWSAFVDHYRGLLIAVARRYARDPDDIMDLFAHMCERLRENNLARLRRYAADANPRASFSTWLVVVARNLCVDWIRARDGRTRVEIPDGLSAAGKRVYEYVFVRGHSHREAFELVTGSSSLPVTPEEFQSALRDAHAAAFKDSGVRRAAGATAVADREADGDDVAKLDPAADDDVRRRLAHAMAGLTDDVRLAVQLFVVEEVPAADVARALGWANAKAVYNNVYRALATIRATLADQGIGKGDL